MTFIEKLEEISNISATNDKLIYLMKNKDDEELAIYLKLAIDTRITFNVSKFEFKLGEAIYDDTRALENFISLCTQLQKREITGNIALESIATLFSKFSASQAKWFSLCLQKDTALLGVGKKLSNKVWPGLVLDFKVSLASPEDEIEKFDWSNGAVCELKLNGVRTIIVVRNGKIECVYGRSGLPIRNFEFFGDVIEQACVNIDFPQNFVLDGEVHVENSLENTMSLFGFDLEKSEQDFIGKTGKVSSGWKTYKDRREEIIDFQTKAVYSIFDFLELSEWDNQKCITKYTDRWNKVCAFIRDMEVLDLDCYFAIPDHNDVQDIAEAMEYARGYISQGLEGAILKSAQHYYSFKRDREWIKIKEEVETDIQVLGITKSKDKYNSDGSKKPDMMGTFIVRDQGGREYEIGTGKYLSEDRRIHIWENQDEYINKIFYVTAQRFTETAAICPRVEYQRLDKTSLD